MTSGYAAKCYCTQVMLLAQLETIQVTLSKREGGRMGERERENGREREGEWERERGRMGEREREREGGRMGERGRMREREREGSRENDREGFKIHW